MPLLPRSIPVLLPLVPVIRSLTLLYVPLGYARVVLAGSRLRSAASGQQLWHQCIQYYNWAGAPEDWRDLWPKAARCISSPR